MDVAWSPTAPSLVVSVDPDTVPFSGCTSNRLAAPTGAMGAEAVHTPATPLDLSGLDELRFWVRADRRADGSPEAPFYMELSYVDASAPGSAHRWYVPVNRGHSWEQRRIGFRPENSRAAVTRIALRVVGAAAFTCHVSELLAVREALLADVESAVAATLAAALTLPGLTAVPMVAPLPPAGGTTVVAGYTPGFHVGNRVRLDGAGSGAERHDVTGVAHDAGLTRTTLTFANTDAVIGTFATPGTIAVEVPVLVAEMPPSSPAPTPSVQVSHIETRIDLERTGYGLQRDSFRPHPTQPLTLCSVRPMPRAFVVSHELAVRAPVREQQVALLEQLLGHFAGDVPLRINGMPAPARVFTPASPERAPGQPAPLALAVGTRLEVAPRREQTAVRRLGVAAAPSDAPLDLELVEIEP